MRAFVFNMFNNKLEHTIVFNYFYHIAFLSLRGKYPVDIKQFFAFVLEIINTTRSFWKAALTLQIIWIIGGLYIFACSKKTLVVC